MIRCLSIRPFSTIVDSSFLCIIKWPPRKCARGDALSTFSRYSFSRVLGIAQAAEIPPFLIVSYPVPPPLYHDPPSMSPLLIFFHLFSTTIFNASIFNASNLILLYGTVLVSRANFAFVPTTALAPTHNASSLQLSPVSPSHYTVLFPTISSSSHSTPQHTSFLDP